MNSSDRISLCISTRNPRVDEILCGLVGIFEAVFPQQIRGYFVSGSYAGDYEIQGSDIDVKVIFRGKLEKEIARQAEDISQFCDMLSPIELDISISDEAGRFKPGFIFGSTLIYGTDVRENLSLVPIVAWVRDRMHAGCWLINHLFNRRGYVRLPIEYPDPWGEFYGYDDRPTRRLDGTQTFGTRNLMRATGWAATALIGLKTNQYVTSKTQCLTMYRQYIDDTWTAHLENIHQKCRLDWKYLIPEEPDERKELRNICHRNLSFENHFMRIYKDYLVGELRHAEFRSQRDALESLKRTPFYDNAVISAVKDMVNSENPKIRNVVGKIERKLEETES